MAAPQIQWKGPPVPRAKPVPAELWEEHKEELCNLYQKMKLDDLMTMMRVRHHFTPSRRQYISQMEKWGIGKYNKSNPGNPEAEAHTIHNTPSLLHREHEQKSIGESKQRPPKPPPPKRNAPNGKPDVLPKKRQKLANFLSEKAYEDLALAFDRFPSLEEACQNVDLVSEKDTGGGQNFSADYKQNSDILTVQNMPIPNIHTWEDENDGDDISSCSDDLEHNSDNSEVGLANAMSDINLANFEDFRVAADFLFASNFYGDAFEIYVLLLQNLNLLDKYPDLREKMMIAAIIGCGRCAMTPSQIAIAVNVLSQKLSHRPIYSEETPEILIYRCLIKDLYRKQGNMTEADFQERLIARSSFVQNKCLSPPMPDNPTLSLQLYIYLNQFLSSGRLITINNLQKELLSLRPRLFEYDAGHIRRNSIRSCLEWCSSHCRRRTYVTPGYEIGGKSIDLEHNTFLALFGELWHHSKDQTAFLSEVDRVEMGTGISSTEFLAVVCKMIITAAPLISTAEIKVLLGPMGPHAHSTIFLRLLDGVNSLLRHSDWTITNEFLKAYSATNKDRIPVTTPKNIVYWNVKSFLEKNLCINIPDTLNADQYHQDGDAKSTIYFTGILETLCPSLHSSTFSSLRALKNRLEENIEQRADSFSLPSTMMGEGSMVSMLFPLSARTGSLNSQASLHGGSVASSALDTLATVSSCVKDRLAEIEYRAAGMHQIS